jgi:Xaa-Pro aminopeptidase
MGDIGFQKALVSCHSERSEESQQGRASEILRYAQDDKLKVFSMPQAAKMNDVAPYAERLSSLQDMIKTLGLNGFLLPRSDEYQNEYLPACAQRVEWLTGFTGSWGLAAVLKDKAAVFIDGRYTIQAAQEVDGSLFEIVCIVDRTIEDWLAENLPLGAKLGYDPWLHTKDGLAQIKKSLEPKNTVLVPLEKNPVDRLWSNRPPPPLSPVRLHDEKYAGESVAAKLKRIRNELKKSGATHLVVTQTDNLAWTFNIRGSDVEHTPLSLGFAVIGPSSAQIFMDERKVKNNIREALEGNSTFAPIEGFADALQNLPKDAKVLVDPKASALAVRDAVKTAGCKLVETADPITLMKAQKNAVELEGARAAHKRDGAAMARFLHWFAIQDKTKLTEMDLVDALYKFRKDTGAFQDTSFDSICGSGPNGAIAHYRVTPQSNRKLDNNSLVVVDSGAQYFEGTTDITRTVFAGKASDPMRRNFTLVLKGMIAISLARFPKDTRGIQLDTLARQALWEVGLDYDHGTGHGVGSYLGVHEGPSRISKIPTPPLKSGMILSNEPGYYEEGAYGLRIENLIVVTPLNSIEGGNRAMHAFETLTLAPIERDLIDVKLLDDKERDWLNAYHARVLKEIGPLVDETVRGWLVSACAPL